MEENVREIQIDENTTVLTDDPELDVTDLVAADQDDNSINPVAAVGTVAAIAGAGYLIYKGGKAAIGWIGNQLEKGSKKRLEKRGYTVLPPREDPADLEVVGDENFEDEASEPETKNEKK